jgi:hypothetical protein
MSEYCPPGPAPAETMMPAAETEATDRLILETRYATIAVLRKAFDIALCNLAGPEAKRRAERLGTPSQEEQTAHHEAGHAVIDRLLGFAVFDASVIPDPRSNGRVRSQPTVETEPFTKHHRDNRRAVAVLFAGSWGIEPKRSSVETRELRWLRRRVRYEARRLVQMHWPLIEAVAAGLLAYKILTGEQIDAIIAAVRQAEVERARARWASPCSGDSNASRLRDARHERSRQGMEDLANLR